MKDRTALRERFLRDSIPIRLGGLAANLSRVQSFAGHEANQQVVVGLLEESKFFIEWTAAETDLETAAELVDLQVQLACWQKAWHRIWNDRARRQQVAIESGRWSQRVLELSGLLG